MSTFLKEYTHNNYLFANLCLDILYNKLPSYGYFSSNTELNIEYWNEFNNTESKKILYTLNDRYTNDPLISSLLNNYKFIPYKDRLLKIILSIN